MKVKNLGSNQTQIEKQDGTSILVFYQTPVAACIPGRGFVRSAKFFSVTTSKHINRWLDGANASKVPQAELDALL